MTGPASRASACRSSNSTRTVLAALERLRSRQQVVDYLPFVRGMQWDFASENRRRLALA